MSQKIAGTFPYSNNPTIARTDGIIAGNSVETSIFVPGPNDITQSLVEYRNRGVMCEEYIGNTGCVDTNTTTHEIFTGSF